MFKFKKSLLCVSIAGMMSAGHVGLATAADISVCPSGCDYTAVQDGINAASAGDRVVVGTPGRTTAEAYAGNIMMKGSVDVVSEGDNSLATYTDPFRYRGDHTVLKRATLTILSGSQNSAVVVFPFNDSENVALDGFTIENQPGLVNDAMGLVMIQNTSPTIRNNIIRRNEGTGISPGIMMLGNMGAMANGTITPLIENNLIHYINGPGVAVGPNAYPTIRNNTIFTTPPDFSGHEYMAPGIGLRDSASAIIEGNDLGYNRPAGIGTGLGTEVAGQQRGFAIYDSGNDLIIRNNHIHWHNLAGIQVAGQRDMPTSNINVVIENNDIHNNMAGIRTSHGNIDGVMGTFTIRGNTFDTHAAGILAAGISTLIVDDNEIENSNMAGIRTQYVEDIQIRNNSINNSTNRAGIALFGQPFFTNTFTIENNTITNSGRAGIRLNSKQGSSGVVRGNVIDGSGYGGIVVMNAMTVDILDNEIMNSVRGGIHTGYNEYSLESSPLLGFGSEGNLHMTVRGNKVHHNGQDDLGGGIDVRHADGVVENNLVYANNMGGIRVGDWIDAVNNNTVVANGMGGIAYDDIEGAVNDLPHGSPAMPFAIKNNLLVGNGMAGVNAGTVSFTYDAVNDVWNPEMTGTCDNWIGNREYNLFTLNNGLDASCNGDVVFPFCYMMQTATCALNDGEILADPMFVDAANGDFQLQSGSPALGSGVGGVDMGAYGGATPLNW